MPIDISHHGAKILTPINTMACYIAKDVTQTWIKQATVQWHFQLQPRSSSICKPDALLQNIALHASCLKETQPGTSITG
jgi:hypothetical protein